MNINKKIIEAKKEYKKFLEYTKERYPIYAKNKIKKYSKYELIINYIALIICIKILKINIYKNIPKYIFQGLKYKHLLEILPSNEIMIIGGRNEYQYCKEKGYKFHWSGYIGKAFELYYFGGMVSPYYQALKNIKKLINEKPYNLKYIILWEDTQPIGMSLSLILKGMENIKVICIAHGYEYKRKSKQKMRLDGSNCEFNLVYDQEHAKFYNREKTFILGLPYEVKKSENIKNKVILVEEHGTSAGEEYIYCLNEIIKIYKILKKSEIEVVYRPRPGSDKNYLSGIFTNIYDGNKFNLFEEGRMIYIGFNSTLLYEAKAYGNIIIGIKSDVLYNQRNFSVDININDEKYEELPEIIRSLNFNEIKENEVDNKENLKSRFIRCIELIKNSK